MVRLLQEKPQDSLFCGYPGFNPTMVRLLLLVLRSLLHLRRAFQSHNGAIAALLAASSR